MNNFSLKCQQHQSKQILFICLHSHCSQKRKCCLTCIDDHHQGHEIISIAKFIQQTNHYLQRYNTHPQKKQIIKLLKYIEGEIRKNIEWMKTAFISKVNKIEQKIIEQFNLVRSVFFFPDEQTVTSHILKTLESTDVAINEYITNVQKAKRINIGSFEDMNKYVECQASSICMQINNAGQQAVKLLNKVQKFMSEVKFSNKQHTQDLKFSFNHKAIGIQLADSTNCVSGITTAHNYSVCLLDKPFDPINDKFFVRIDKNPNKKIWLGACLLEVVRKSNFIGCNGHGKGTYAIDQSSSIAYSYNNPNNYATLSNHHYSEYNSSKTAGWTFKEGDVLMVQLLYSNGEIGFYKLNQNYNPQIQQSSILIDSYQMPIDPNCGQLYPFVGFSGISTDSVTILSKKQILHLISSYGNAWLQMLNAESSDLDIF